MDGRSKYHWKASHLVRPHDSFCLNTNSRIEHLRNNSRTFINRLNWSRFLNLGFFFFIVFFLFSFFLSLFILLLLIPSSLLSYPHSHTLHFLSFSCTTINHFPSQLLFLPLLIHSFPCLHLILLSFPNLLPHYASILHTHHLLTSLLYQVHTTPVPGNPWHKHSSLQQKKYTQTHTRATKHSNPLTHSFSHPCFLVPPLPLLLNL
jgi:hypothetical protein